MPSGTVASTHSAAALAPRKRPTRWLNLRTEVEYRIGAKPVSSSRSTTLATSDTITKIENRLMTPRVCRIAYGELVNTLPRLRAGRTQIHVLAEAAPDPSFRPVTGS